MPSIELFLFFLADFFFSKMTGPYFLLKFCYHLLVLLYCIWCKPSGFAHESFINSLVCWYLWLLLQIWGSSCTWWRTRWPQGCEIYPQSFFYSSEAIWVSFVITWENILISLHKKWEHRYLYYFLMFKYYRNNVLLEIFYCRIKNTLNFKLVYYVFYNEILLLLYCGIPDWGMGVGSSWEQGYVTIL